MRNSLYRYLARDRGDDAERGFTLIELLVVIGVLGILAGVTVFALSSVNQKSAAAACNSDASSVNAALQAFYAQNPASTAATNANLVNNTAGGPYIQTFPSSPTHYVVTLFTAPFVPPALPIATVVQVAAPPAAAAATWTPGAAGSLICSKAT